MSKKAIVVISFGTTYVEALEKSIATTEERFKSAFPEYEVRRAFTSEAVIDKLAEKSGIQVDGLGAALKKLEAEGFSEVYLQPLYLTADKTYAHIKEYVVKLAHSKERTFAKITIGRPLLLSIGFKDHPDDYQIAIAALRSQMPELGGEQAVVLMCNGTQQLEYSVLQLKLADAGIKNAFVYTAEGYPAWDGVIRQLKECGAKEVVLAPFVFVASEHVFDYLAGDKPDSARTQLEGEGYAVSVYPKGLGENPAIQDIFVQHLKDALRAMETKHGHCRQLAHGEQGKGHGKH